MIANLSRVDVVSSRNAGVLKSYLVNLRVQFSAMLDRILSRLSAVKPNTSRDTFPSFFVVSNSAKCGHNRQVSFFLP